MWPPCQPGLGTHRHGDIQLRLRLRCRGDSLPHCDSFNQNSLPRSQAREALGFIAICFSCDELINSIGLSGRTRQSESRPFPSRKLTTARESGPAPSRSSVRVRQRLHSWPHSLQVHSCSLAQPAGPGARLATSELTFRRQLSPRHRAGG